MSENIKIMDIIHDMEIILDEASGSVSYTHLTLPTILLV